VRAFLPGVHVHADPGQATEELKVRNELAVKDWRLKLHFIKTKRLPMPIDAIEDPDDRFIVNRWYAEQRATCQPFLDRLRVWRQERERMQRCLLDDSIISQLLIPKGDL
jgi:hypothetical protein